MVCPSLIDPVCVISPVSPFIGPAAGIAAGAAASGAASGAMNGIAGAIQSGIGWVVSGTIDWWVQAPSPDLAGEPAIGALQQWLLPIAVAVAVVAMTAAAAKMALTRKANPLIDVGSGLAIIAVTSAVGVLLPEMLLKAGDAWSSWVLAVSTGGQFGARLTAALKMAGAAPGVVIVLGIIAIIMAAVQSVLMLFRQAALLILAGVLPLAAAGTLAPGTRSWFRRVTGWMLALIFYKPAAAAVYATAFTMIGRGKDPRTVLMGFTMVLLSLLALPVLMKLFTWTTGAVEAAAAGGGFLGTLMNGAIAVGALRGSSGGSGGSSAPDQARLVSAQLGSQGISGPQGAAGPGGADAAPASGPGSGASPAAGGGSGSWPAGPPGAGAGEAAAAGAGGPAGAGAGGSVAAGAGTAGTAAGGAAAGAGTGAAAGGAGAAAGAAAAGAAAGPAGVAVAGLASGAAQAGRRAADAMGPEGTES